MYILPVNKLRLDPVVKLFKMEGVVPAGLKIYNDGIDIKSILKESNEWIRASYKFICRIFQDNPHVNVKYIKECSNDKALVDVIVNYNNQKENLKDLLIREKYAFAVDNADEDTTIVPQHTFDEIDSHIRTPSTVSDERISNSKLNIEIKSWLVSKYIEKTADGQSVIKYKYKNPIRPVLSYQNDQVMSSFLKDALSSYKTKSLFPVQATMIPAILRGINVMAIAPLEKGKSTGILMPILQKIATKLVSETRSFSPLAVILCSSWSKVQQLSESANIFLKFIDQSTEIRRPTIVSSYNEQMERRIMMPILEGCDVLIITPKSLLTLLTTHEFFKLNELEILGLDDADNLFSEQFSVLKNIFSHRDIGVEHSRNNVQHVVTASSCTSELRAHLAKEMGDMFFLTVNDPLESAILAGVKHKLIECPSNSIGLYGKILSYLEMKECTINRTVIFASDDKQIRSIFTYLSLKVSFDLKLMVGAMSYEELRAVENEWNRHSTSVRIPVLLISDEALCKYDASIFKAQTIFHIGLNGSMFKRRLNFLKDQFIELSSLEQSCDALTACYHSYIFLSVDGCTVSDEKFLRELLNRSQIDIPKWLHLMK